MRARNRALEGAAVGERFKALNVWRRAGERAPHKPLLVLLALGRFEQGVRELAFLDCEHILVDLLREFGPTRRSYHPEYPFWRLQNDRIWEVVSERPMGRRISNSDPPRAELRAANAIGRFTADVQRQLRSSPELIVDIARSVLDANFPESLHGDISSAVGLSLARSGAQRRSRDPRFRSQVLVAYEYRCAVCGMDLRIGNSTVGLEAAHIMWYQADGPDALNNGIALCSLHHKLFDFGAFTVDRKWRVLVSECVNGSTQLQHTLLQHHGQPLRSPTHPENRPAVQYLEWHQKWVFKGRPRFLEDG